MKYLLISLVVFLLFSCEAQEKKMNEIASRIKSCNVNLFKGVRMEASHKKNGIYRVPYFSKEIGDTLYLLPNYSFFGCSTNDTSCLELATKKKYNLIEFAKVNGIVSKKEALIYTGRYIDEVIAEYEKIGVIDILSDSKIGECVIFYLDKEHYVAFVYDTDKIYTEYWKSKFIPQNKIASNWYSNIK
jgi:hypothetical protein